MGRWRMILSVASSCILRKSHTKAKSQCDYHLSVEGLVEMVGKCCNQFSVLTLQNNHNPPLLNVAYFVWFMIPWRGGWFFKDP